MASAEPSGRADVRYAPPVLLYVVSRSSTFIQRDVAGLSARYDVRVHELLKGPKWMLPVRLMGQLAWLIVHRAWRRDIICHFSGYHAVLPALIGRRCMLILAGSDCASIPGIGYGNHARILLGWATRFAVRHATRLLPVHASLMERYQTYSDIVPVAQGIKAFVPDLTTPWTEIPYGFDTSFWTPYGAIERDQHRFICVSGPAAPGNRVQLLKGVDLLLSIAQQLPQAKFTIVGVADPLAYDHRPPNMEFIRRVDPEALRNMLRTSSFYTQLSLSEGMPNALCEAMLCGCVPLVSNVASMPDIVGEHGSVLERRDVELGVQACLDLLTLPANERNTRSIGARRRIVERFPMKRRMERLLSVLNPNDQRSDLPDGSAT